MPRDDSVIWSETELDEKRQKRAEARAKRREEIDKAMSENQPPDGSGSDTNAALAIRYSADHGARVSNNSWGGSGNGTALSNAISYAGSKGEVFVVAAYSTSEVVFAPGTTAIRVKPCRCCLTA